MKTARALAKALPQVMRKRIAGRGGALYARIGADPDGVEYWIQANRIAELAKVRPEALCSVDFTERMFQATWKTGALRLHIRTEQEWEDLSS